MLTTTGPGTQEPHDSRGARPSGDTHDSVDEVRSRYRFSEASRYRSAVRARAARGGDVATVRHRALVGPRPPVVDTPDPLEPVQRS